MKTCLIFVLFASFSQIKAQKIPSLYEPRNIQAAYNNGTRNRNGQPGKNYWQNHGKYDITVTIMPPDRTVRGTERITYFNNSPDTLRYLVIKLFNNFHKPGAVRIFPADSNFLTSGVHIDSVALNGADQPWKDSRWTNTYHVMRLKKLLPPNDSLHLYFKWHYKVSKESDREGMIDSTTFYIAYFYPRVAVYDDYEGWDRNEFNGALEFYSDFNDYTLRVKAPANFIVWSTGTLVNPEDVLQPSYVRKLNESMYTGRIIHIVTPEDLATKNITAQKPVNTWRWKAGNIADMAFGISDHYDWDATSVVVDDATGRRASAQAAYNDTAADYHYVAGFARHALDWFSHNWPGIPYPYEKTTVFQGFSGMEYPMMVNCQSYSDTVLSKWVDEHEIAHTYMPFYMGINETDYGFMDEGWATTFELLIGRADQGKEKADSSYEYYRVLQWANSKSGDMDLPVIIPGTNLTTGMGINEYGKASLGYLAVKDILGDTLFKTCLQAYMQRWHGKHPDPWDFFYTFNDVSSRNLNWFWNNWFFSFNHIDLTLEGVTKTRKGFDITVKNTGGMDIPFDIKLLYADGTKEVIHVKPDLWKSGEREEKIGIETRKKLQAASIDNGLFLDADRFDNSWTGK